MTKKKKSKKTTGPDMPSLEKDFMAEDDLRTLKRAEEIKMDSKRLKACKKVMEIEMKAMSHISALKDHIKNQKGGMTY